MGDDYAAEQGIPPGRGLSQAHLQAIHIYLASTVDHSHPASELSEDMSEHYTTSSVDGLGPVLDTRQFSETDSTSEGDSFMQVSDSTPGSSVTFSPGGSLVGETGGTSASQATSHPVQTGGAGLSAERPSRR